MTRKRFVKLLMGQGFSRNEANMLKISARLERDSYKTALSHIALCQQTLERDPNFMDIVRDPSFAVLGRFYFYAIAYHNHRAPRAREE